MVLSSTDRASTVVPAAPGCSFNTLLCSAGSGRTGAGDGETAWPAGSLAPPASSCAHARASAVSAAFNRSSNALVATLAAAASRTHSASTRSGFIGAARCGFLRPCCTQRCVVLGATFMRKLTIMIAAVGARRFN